MLYNLQHIDDGWIAVAAVGILASATICIFSIVQSGRERRRRLDLMEAALRSPNLAVEVQQELVRALRPAPLRAPFVVGWFGAFAGVGWLCCDPRGEAWWWAISITVFSFALLTLPFALRELEARRA